MDWKECINKRIVKNIKEDRNLINSTKENAKLKIESANLLPPHLKLVKITLLYDALREYLECTALKEGYKIYNHECYSAFLKEILKLSNEAEHFDKLRKIRNGINYYGKNLNEEEAEKTISSLILLINKFKN